MSQKFLIGANIVLILFMAGFGISDLIANRPTGAIFMLAATGLAVYSLVRNIKIYKETVKKNSKDK
jgi:uncharacterized YccA/Bax inhibitor family protein